MPRLQINPLLSRGDKRKIMYVVDQYNAAQVEPFVLTINTALGTGTAFTLPLPSGQTYNFYWTPYEGATPLQVTAYDDANATYDYGVDGTYTVSIGVNHGDKCGGWSFNNGGDRLKVTAVTNWGDVGFDYLASAFYGCSNLTSLAEGFNFANATSSSNFIRTCTSLISVDMTSWDFSNINDMVAFAYGCSNLETLLLPGSTLGGVNSFAFFAQNCTKLEALNETTWDVSSVTNFYSAFFNDIALVTLNTNSWNTSSVTNCVYMCYNCTSLTSSFLSTLWWDRTIPISSYTDCFKNATSITNYVDIPFEWKGLVEVGTLTTDQSTLTQVNIFRYLSAGLAEVNWGDGTFVRSSSGVTDTKDYSSTGTYDIKLGAESSTLTTAIQCNNSKLTSISGLKTASTAFTRFTGNSLGAVDLTDAPISVDLRLQNNTGVALTLASSNGNLGTVYAYSCALSSIIDFSLFSGQLAAPNIDVKDNGWSSTLVDNQLINLDNAGWINGTLNIAGTNAARTSASDTAYANLISNGWTITVN